MEIEVFLRQDLKRPKLCRLCSQPWPHLTRIGVKTSIFGLMGLTISFQSFLLKQHGTISGRELLRSLGLIWYSLKKRFQDVHLWLGWQYSPGFLQKIDFPRGAWMFLRFTFCALMDRNPNNTCFSCAHMSHLSGLTSLEALGKLLYLLCLMW